MGNSGGSPLEVVQESQLCSPFPMNCAEPPPHPACPEGPHGRTHHKAGSAAAIAANHCCLPRRWLDVPRSPSPGSRAGWGSRCPATCHPPARGAAARTVSRTPRRAVSPLRRGRAAGGHEVKPSMQNGETAARNQPRGAILRGPAVSGAPRTHTGQEGKALAQGHSGTPPCPAPAYVN